MWQNVCSKRRTVHVLGHEYFLIQFRKVRFFLFPVCEQDPNLPIGQKGSLIKTIKTHYSTCAKRPSTHLLEHSKKASNQAPTRVRHVRKKQKQGKQKHHNVRERVNGWSYTRRCMIKSQARSIFSQQVLRFFCTTFNVVSSTIDEKWETSSR